MKFEVQCEPSFLVLGPYHFAVGMNDRSWIYSIGKFYRKNLYIYSRHITNRGILIITLVLFVSNVNSKKNSLIRSSVFLLTGDETQEMERSFYGSISGFALSAEYFACMFEGKIQLMQVKYKICKTSFKPQCND